MYLRKESPFDEKSKMNTWFNAQLYWKGKRGWNQFESSTYSSRSWTLRLLLLIQKHTTVVEFWPLRDPQLLAKVELLTDTIQSQWLGSLLIWSFCGCHLKAGLDCTSFLWAGIATTNAGLIGFRTQLIVKFMVVLLGSQDRREHTYLVQDCNELKHLTAKENP